jgi:hypothetical protein
MLRIILVSLTMTLFSEKNLISTQCICSFMPNLNKKSLMVSIQGVLYLFIDLRKEANITGTLMLEIVSHISLMAVQALPPVLKGISLFWQKKFPF